MRARNRAVSTKTRCAFRARDTPGRDLGGRNAGRRAGTIFLPRMHDIVTTVASARVSRSRECSIPICDRKDLVDLCSGECNKAHAL